jgi:four helix bundle protein
MLLWHELCSARVVMSRDYRKLRVFRLADTLVLEVYRVTEHYPESERYGLRSQLRRAAVSTLTNIVESSYRRSTRDYLRFIEISMSSGAEAELLIGVSRRLGFLRESEATPLKNGYVVLLKSLQKLMTSLSEAAKHEQ